MSPATEQLLQRLCFYHASHATLFGCYISECKHEACIEAVTTILWLEVQPRPLRKAPAPQRQAAPRSRVAG